MMSPSRERMGGSGGVPRGVIAGSVFRTSGELSGELSFMLWNFDAGPFSYLSLRTSSPLLCLITNARIEIAVSDVDQQVHQQQDDRNESDDPDN